jgi:uncharacterized protein YciI
VIPTQIIKNKITYLQDICNTKGDFHLEEFLYLIKPIRAYFLETITQEESVVMEKHFQYLKELLAVEKLILAGPCLDGAFGICIIKTDSRESAERIMKKDPAVSEGIIYSELHPYRVSLLQGR